jgi:stringent starvation protein B
MTSTRPYLIRAIHEWILDNQMTPHILVDSQHDQVVVPRQYEEDHKIVLNISPSATQALSLGDDAVAFNARFDGSPMQVYIPIQYVLAIYTRENGQGMMFNEEEGSEPTPDPDSPTPQPTEQSSTGASVEPSSKSSKPSKAHLKVVK